MVKSIFSALDQWDDEDAHSPVSENEINRQWDIDTLRSEARNNSDIAAERMVDRARWRHDEVIVTVGSRVVRAVNLDTNTNTRRFALMEHIDTRIYIVTERYDRGLLKLVEENNHTNVILGVPSRNVKIIG